MLSKESNLSNKSNINKKQNLRIDKQTLPAPYFCLHYDKQISHVISSLSYPHLAGLQWRQHLKMITWQLNSVSRLPVPSWRCKLNIALSLPTSIPQSSNRFRTPSCLSKHDGQNTTKIRSRNPPNRVMLWTLTFDTFVILFNPHNGRQKANLMIETPA